MTDSRRTYKTAKRPRQKYASITFRVTEEEREQIRRNAHDAGCRTESEYLRLVCRLNETVHLSQTRLLAMETDITYCKDWITTHKDSIETIITAAHPAENILA
ncbi:MAG: hypothetical protein J6J70_02930 [Methanocorpusculaceae archaeon]|nr:hypothetical protein [Methanocorpusculaceae archaeon]